MFDLTIYHTLIINNLASSPKFSSKNSRSFHIFTQQAESMIFGYYFIWWPDVDGIWLELSQGDIFAPLACF